MALIYHDKIENVSIHGQAYSANEDGFFDVPDDVAIELIKTFGFVMDDTNMALQRPKYLAHWKIEDLQAEAERLGIKGAKTKKELIEAIKAVQSDGNDGDDQ